MKKKNTRSEQIHVRLPEPVMAWLREQAEKQHTSMNEIVLQAVIARMAEK